MREIKRVLIANRGEIALRIIRAARELGVETVAVYSSADEGTIPVRLADQKIALGGASARDSYLNFSKMVHAAIQSGTDAVHPGYGFFAENAKFAAAIRQENICFIGPAADAMGLMGNKDEARKTVAARGVPIVPGTTSGLSVRELREFAGEVGFPVLVKAVAGGSGRGMRVVQQLGELDERIAEAKREALGAFGNDEIIIEKYIERPRHIEVQVFGDEQGNIVHFGERECSLQRRHQKVVEESPAPNLHPRVRERLCDAAVSAAKAVNYQGAGTCEFLVEGGESERSPIYFLEMNTRIQVEHPVTEQVTSHDLVKLQFHVASGKPLPLSQQQIVTRGHAIEFRISAEDPADGHFRPTSGEILYLSRPGGPGVREDSWIEAGTKVSSYYDSLLAKLVITAATREEALVRAQAALDEYVLEGVRTTLPFHRWVVRQKDFLAGRVDVGWIGREYRGESGAARGTGPLELPKRRTAAKR